MLPPSHLEGLPVAEPGPPFRKVLLIAYHFPPQAGSSGHLRSLKYCRYLLENGWLATVLSIHPRVYSHSDNSQLQEIPSEVKVIRAFALDTQKHLSLRGRYLRYLALPDRWATWCFGAVPAGLWQIYRGKCEVILSTFPIPTAVLIGLILKRFSRLPWVIDFRDSMTEDDYPRDPFIRRVLRWLEGKAVKHAALLIFTAPSARRMYLQRYPSLSAEKCVLISNGFDEQDFQGISASLSSGGKVRLLHFGLVYREERNPIPFFRAVMHLKREGIVDGSWFSVDLRACGNDEEYSEITRNLGIDDIVRFLPALPYRQALGDASSADALLLLQAANCDHQIPAKAYEYLRLGKPILGLTSHTGDTAALLRECGGSTIAEISDEQAIKAALGRFVSMVRAGRHSLPQQGAVAKHGRRAQARELSQCLSRAAGSTTPGLTVAMTENAGIRS